MTIYKIVVYDTGFRWYFASTKQEANLIAKREYVEPFDKPSIETLNYPATRAGLVEALTDFVSETALNEH